MKDIDQLVRENEANLEDYLNWQIEHGPTSNFRLFAEMNAKAQEVFRYAAILVEDNVVLENHYSKENWASWREKLAPKDAANIVNHVHIDSYLPSDYQGTQKIEDGLGDLLTFFWQLSVNHQFPDKKVLVECNGDVINILNL
jgi:hypothetical protein